MPWGWGGYTTGTGGGQSNTDPGGTGDGGGWWSNIPWGDIFRGVAGGAAGYYGARQAEKASEGAGQYEGTTANQPWAPSVPYREFGMERALDLLGLGGSRPPAPGGGGGGGWSGPSQESLDLLGLLQGRAERGSPLYGSGNRYVQQTLAGQDQNPYRADLFGRLGSLEDPDLERFKDMLFGGSMPGTTDVLGDVFNRLGGFRGIAGGGGGGGGGGEFNAPVGAADYIKAILNEKYLSGENPNVEAMIEAATRGAKENFYDRDLPGILSQFGGQGRFGGGIATQYAATEAGKLGNALSDTEGQIRYSEYENRMKDLMNALGLGTQMDMQAADLAQRASAASGAAGASRFGSQLGFLGQLEGLASQERLARMGALQGAIGQGMDLTQFGLSGQQGLAGLFGQDQNFALSMIPELSGLDIRDLQAALEPRLALDQMRMQSQEARAGRRSGNEWQRYLFDVNRPWEEAGMYGDLINAFSGGYGSQATGGFQNQWAPYMGDPLQQGLAGFLGGYYGGWGGGGGGGQQGPQGQGQQLY